MQISPKGEVTPATRVRIDRGDARQAASEIQAF